ncbi:MAG: DciA family protein [Patescibacteria group bacterium]
MQSIRDFIFKKREEFSVDDKTVLFIATQAIEREFGQVGRENIFPEKVVSKTLIIKSSGSLWAAELWSRRQVIVLRVNSELGKDVIERVKIN